MAFSNLFSYSRTLQTYVYDSTAVLGIMDGINGGVDDAEYATSVRFANDILKEKMATPALFGSIKFFQKQYGFMFLQSNTSTYVLAAGQTYWANAFTTTTSAGENSAGSTTVNLSDVSGISVNTVVGLQDDTGYINWVTVTVVNNVADTISFATGIANNMNDTSDVCYIITDGSSQPPQAITSVMLRDSGGNDVEMTYLTPDQWDGLPTKNSPGFTGDPVAYTYEPHLVGANGFGYLKTDVNGSDDTTKYLVIAYVREIQDLVNTSDYLEVPKEWYRWMVYELAYVLADVYSVEWTPQRENKRQEALRQALQSNPVRETRGFMPGNRGGLWSMQDGFFSR